MDRELNKYLEDILCAINEIESFVGQSLSVRRVLLNADISQGCANEHRHYRGGNKSNT